MADGRSFSCGLGFEPTDGSRFVTADMSLAEVNAFGAHLKGCARCTEEVRRQRALDAAVAARPLHHPSAPRRRARRANWRWIAIAAGIAAIMVVTVGVARAIATNR